jgi:hypothetical protein
LISDSKARTRQGIDEKPGVLARTLRSVMLARDVIKNDSAQVQKILSDTLKLDPAAPATFWKDKNFEVSVDRERLIGDLMRQAQWASAEGLTKPGAKLPDFETVVVDVIAPTCASILFQACSSASSNVMRDDFSASSASESTRSLSSSSWSAPFCPFFHT